MSSKKLRMAELSRVPLSGRGKVYEEGLAFLELKALNEQFT